MPPAIPPASQINSVPDLIAVAHGRRNEGRFKCHWCGSPCGEQWRHDGPPALPFVKATEPTRCPGEHFICQGCFLYRRERVTAIYLEGGYKDRQCLKNHSWYATPGGVWALRFTSNKALFDVVMAPPKLFSLSLRTDDKLVNYLQAAVLNTVASPKADTPFHFTCNNVKHTYTVYELECAARTGEEKGLSAGTQLLWHYLAQPRIEVKDEKRDGPGRPTSDEAQKAAERQRLTRAVGRKEVVSKSG